MDTEKIKIFLTVIKLKSFTAAADQLGYTTSGISRSIASLEEETGMKLLIRQKGGISLAADAEKLVPILRELSHQADLYAEYANKIIDLRFGTITIGISYEAYFKVISQKIKAFTKTYPNIKVEILQATSSELLKLLEKHEVDFAIMTYRSGNFNFYELQKDPMVVCLAEDHPDAGLEIYPLEKFKTESIIAPYPELETDYQRALKDAGILPRFRYTTTGVYAAYCMVEAGLGISLLNRIEVESWNGKVKIIPTEPEISLEIGIMYPEKDQMTLSSRKFLEDYLIKEEI